MQLTGGKIRRVGVFLFFDRDGIVDSYKEYFLEEYNKYLDRLVIVCNGFVTKEGRKKLENFTDEVLERSNTDYDIGGYKYGITHIGWDEIGRYDELVIANDTTFGPFYPFSEMFDTMNGKDIDFWGITRHKKSEYGGEVINEYGYIPEHIQSYFMVFRNNLTKSDEFKRFWENLCDLNSYWDAVSKFETTFTKKFEDYGYKWDTYINPKELYELTDNVMLNYPKELLDIYKCPLVKKRSFFHDYHLFLNDTLGKQSVELYEYIRDLTEYDVNFIWDTLLRTCHQSDIAKCMQTNYFLSSEPIDDYSRYESCKEKKTALFMHLYFDDLAKMSAGYAAAVPDFTDIYITTNSEEKKKIFEKEFSKLPNKTEVFVTPNRGRDVSSLLVSLKDIVTKYDIACFYHDKKSGQSKPGSVGEGFGYKCSQNVLFNKEYVYRILKTFEDNPRLGILSPPEPNHAEYFASLGYEWFGNYENTVKLAKRLNINVPMDIKKEPVAPFGSVFWFRVDALRPLHDYNWKYEDFPEEPLPVDATISHAIERIRPYAAQAAGYYPGFVMVDKYARIEFTNLREYMKQYCHFCERHGFLISGQMQNIQAMDERFMQLETGEGVRSGRIKTKTVFTLKLMNFSKKVLPSGVYSGMIKVKRKLFGPHDI